MDAKRRERIQRRARVLVKMAKQQGLKPDPKHVEQAEGIWAGFDRPEPVKTPPQRPATPVGEAAPEAGSYSVARLATNHGHAEAATASGSGRTDTLAVAAANLARLAEDCVGVRAKLGQRSSLPTPLLRPSVVRAGVGFPLADSLGSRP